VIDRPWPSATGLSHNTCGSVYVPGGELFVTRNHGKMIRWLIDLSKRSKRVERWWRSVEAFGARAASLLCRANPSARTVTAVSQDGGVGGGSFADYCWSSPLALPATCCFHSRCVDVVVDVEDDLDLDDR
jgi:hypothetical protein